MRYVIFIVCLFVFVCPFDCLVDEKSLSSRLFVCSLLHSRIAFLTLSWAFLCLLTPSCALLRLLVPSCAFKCYLVPCYAFLCPPFTSSGAFMCPLVPSYALLCLLTPSCAYSLTSLAPYLSFSTLSRQQAIVRATVAVLSAEEEVINPDLYPKQRKPRQGTELCVTIGNVERRHFQKQSMMGCVFLALFSFTKIISEICLQKIENRWHKKSWEHFYRRALRRCILLSISL